MQRIEAMDDESLLLLHRLLLHVEREQLWHELSAEAEADRRSGKLDRLPRSSAKRALSCAPDDWRFTNENTIPIKRAIDFGMPNLEIMKTIYAATLLFATLAHAEVTSFSILPSATDPAIKTFNNPHEIYVNRDIIVDHKDGLAQDRHELLLFLPGTHTKGTPRGQGPVAFCELAADLGYHVVTLMYPDEVAAAQFREASDPNAFEEFRMAIIQGGRTKYISIELIGEH